MSDNVRSQCAFRWINSRASRTGKLIARVVLAVSNQIDVRLKSAERKGL